MSELQWNKPDSLKVGTVRERLRKKVLHGYTWTPEEQREVWQLLTGERIEPGKRCPRCGGDSRTWHEGTGTLVCLACDACQGSGYERVPTWMEGGR